MSHGFESIARLLAGQHEHDTTNRTTPFVRVVDQVKFPSDDKSISITPERIPS
jgi:hypothetical protein